MMQLILRQVKEALDKADRPIKVLVGTRRYQTSRELLMEFGANVPNAKVLRASMRIEYKGHDIYFKYFDTTFDVDKAKGLGVEKMWIDEPLKPGVLEELTAVVRPHIPQPSTDL